MLLEERLCLGSPSDSSRPLAMLAGIAQRSAERLRIGRRLFAAPHIGLQLTRNAL